MLESDINKSRFDLINNKFIYFLIALIVPSLVTGPAIPDTIITILSFICLLHIMVNRINIFKNKIIILFLLFYILLISSSLISENNVFSLRSSTVYLRFIFFSILVSLVYFKYPKIIYWISIISCITILFIVIDAIYQFIYSSNLIGLKREHATRISGFFYEKYVLGSFISRLMPLSIIFLFFDERLINDVKIKILLSVFIIFVGIGIILAGERTAFLYYLINISLLFLIFIKIRKIMLFIFIFFSIILLTFFYFNNGIKYRFITTTLEELGLNNKNYQIKVFSEVHQNFYKTSISMFLDNPFFGIGPNNYRIKCSDKNYLLKNQNGFFNACATHPHNSYVQILAETGILGFLIILFLFIVIIYKLINYYIKRITLKKYEKIEVLLLISCLITLFPFVPNGNFFNNWISIIYFLPVGFLISNISKK